MRTETIAEIQKLHPKALVCRQLIGETTFAGAAIRRVSVETEAEVELGWGIECYSGDFYLLFEKADDRFWSLNMVVRKGDQAVTTPLSYDILLQMSKTVEFAMANLPGFAEEFQSLAPLRDLSLNRMSSSSSGGPAKP